MRVGVDDQRLVVGQQLAVLRHRGSVLSAEMLLTRIVARSGRTQVDDVAGSKLVPSTAVVDDQLTGLADVDGDALEPLPAGQLGAHLRPRVEDRARYGPSTVRRTPSTASHRGTPTRPRAASPAAAAHGRPGRNLRRSSSSEVASARGSSSRRVETLSPTPTTTAPPPPRRGARPACGRRRPGRWATSAGPRPRCGRGSVRGGRGDQEGQQWQRAGSSPGRNSIEKVSPARGGDDHDRSSRRVLPAAPRRR